MDKSNSIFNLELAGEFKPDILADPYSVAKPPNASNRIKNYRKINAWENFFLSSAICSVAKSVGSDIEDFHVFAAITGDMFAYLYSKDKPCDSGITNYFFIPAVVKKTYAIFGYDCIYVSSAQIKENFRVVMNMIKSSVDKGIPVLAWGIGNFPFKDGSFGLLPEGSLIGGYDKDDMLYVNVYNRSGDDDGYIGIKNGLNDTKGLFFVGKPITKPDLRDVYKDVINSIPVLLSLPPTEAHVFGKDAFNLWADTLLDDSNFENKTDEELGGIRWNLHLSAYCMVCTSDAINYIKNVVGQYPDFDKAIKILPLFAQMNQLKDNIWSLQGGFEPPLDKFSTHEFRAKIAKILKEMGNTCEMIVNAFE